MALPDPDWYKKNRPGHFRLSSPLICLKKKDTYSFSMSVLFNLLQSLDRKDNFHKLTVRGRLRPLWAYWRAANPHSTREEE